VLFVIFLFHGFRITGVDTHGSALALSTVEWTLAFLAVGFSEEFTFRGYMQFTLTTGIGFWPAALLMSALFAFAHTGNAGETIFGLTQVAAFGIFACIALQRTGNLWWPIGFHAAWDWGQTFFYGVPDSGLQATHNFLHSEFHGRNG
jgi:membrane protease YdiL (CAAX protease family)